MDTAKRVLRELFGSKKFLGLLAMLLVWALGKAGLSASSDELMPILLMIGGWLGAQSLADFGKEKAKIEAETAKVLAEMASKPNSSRGSVPPT